MSEPENIYELTKKGRIDEKYDEIVRKPTEVDLSNYILGERLAKFVTSVLDWKKIVSQIIFIVQAEMNTVFGRKNDD